MMWLAGIGVIGVVAGAAMLATLCRARGPIALLQRLVLGAGFAGLGGLCLTVWLVLRSCEAFSRTTLVAEVRCQRVGPKQFLLTLTPWRGAHPQPARTFSLRGDQWMLSGYLVKWHPWLTAAGVPSYHRPARISGRYADVAEETGSLPTAFALHGGRDRVWEAFHRLDPFLPFVDAAYGTSAFLPVEPDVSHQVLVGASGYLIRPRPANRPRRGGQAP